MPLAPGSKLGRYDVVAFVGAGGMGEVYRARDTELGRDVALKVLRPDRHSDDDARRRLTQEARTASALNHPHIAIVFDVAAQLGVAGAIDLAHAARAYEGHDVVPAQLRSRSQRHTALAASVSQPSHQPNH